MTAKDFVSGYYLHDSIIDEIEESDNGKTISILIDFAFWMQENYCDSDPETGIIKVVFHNVTNFSSPDGINFEECSILDVVFEDETVTFHMLNDFSDESFEIRIVADSVTVLREDRLPT